MIGIRGLYIKCKNTVSTKFDITDITSLEANGSSVGEPDIDESFDG